MLFYNPFHLFSQFRLFCLGGPCDSLFYVSVTSVAMDKICLSKIQNHTAPKIMASNVQAVCIRLLIESFSVQNPEKNE